MQKNNAIVIFASEDMKNASKSELTHKITDKIATQIFLPNPKADEYSIAYRETWGLNDQEFKMLAAMSVDKRQFMLRQGGVSIVASLDLSGMRELDVLSGSDETVRIMNKVVSKSGENQKDWLPAFYEQMRESRGAFISEDSKLFVI